VWKGLRPVLRPLGIALHFLGRGLVRFVLLPVYTTFVLVNIRLERIIVSARGLFFFLFTNRYIFHAGLLIVSIATIGSQLTTPNASASDSVQSSLLYTLVTQGQDESIEEPLYIEPIQGKTSYLGPDTIQAVPDIDYGYDEDTVADLTIPGTVALIPHSDFSGIEPLPQDPADTIVATRTQTENYTVLSGDTVATIARRFGVNVGTIIWANNLSRTAAIRPGNALRIPITSGVFHTVKRGETLGQLAKLYKVDIAAIRATNGNLPTLTPGQEILVPGASPITTPIAINTYAGTRTTASSPVRADIPLSKIRNKAVDVYQELRVGEQDTRNKPEDKSERVVKSVTKLLWPTDLRVINQYWNPWSHTGMDIDGDYANAVYASENGIVEIAGWNNSGYGLMIVVNHQNGIKTRYAHHSKLFVKVGDTVKRGQVIGMVGTTGRSTGTHLHFEVIVNGRRVNPLAYIR
jgi:murein DD-endopeptidase MepM/ murein hydrolase activator NlpD